jgi:hypothetical protein
MRGGKQPIKLANIGLIGIGGKVIWNREIDGRRSIELKMPE